MSPGSVTPVYLILVLGLATANICILEAGVVFKELSWRGGVWVGPVGGCLFKFDFPEPSLFWVGGWVFGGSGPPPLCQHTSKYSGSLHKCGFRIHSARTQSSLTCLRTLEDHGIQVHECVAFKTGLVYKVD